MRRTSLQFVLAAAVALSLGFACGGPPPEQQTGTLCAVADDCYPEIDHALLGAVFCEDMFDDGYCTHTCETDADCCAIEGECAPGILHVCTPLSNDMTKRCWVSCEADVLDGVDPAAYCDMHAGIGGGCRSSGGGNQNRDICAPP